MTEIKKEMKRKRMRKIKGQVEGKTKMIKTKENKGCKRKIRLCTLGTAENRGNSIRRIPIFSLYVQVTVMKTH
jgi:hypothetical protein